MSELYTGFTKSVVQAGDRRFVQRLGEVVKLAISPFNLGKATLWIEDYNNLFSGERVFCLELERLPNYPFKHKFNERDMMRDSDPEAFIYESVGKTLFNHFRYRPSLPVEEHIILGEE